MFHAHPGNAQHKKLAGQDAQIDGHNKKLKTSHDAKLSAQNRFETALSQGNPAQIERASKAMERAKSTYSKTIAASLDAVGSGSGKVGILLPPDAILRRRAP